MVIRDFEASDLPAVLALNVQAIHPDASAEYSVLHYPDLLDIPSNYQRDGAFLVAIRRSGLVAMGAVSATQDGICELRYVRVASAHQRKGYGRSLIEALERRAAARGARCITLDTTEEQIPAQRLYEAAGFTETHRSIATNRSGVEFKLVHYRKRIHAD